MTLRELISLAKKQGVDLDTEIRINTTNDYISVGSAIAHRDSRRLIIIPERRLIETGNAERYIPDRDYFV